MDTLTVECLRCGGHHPLLRTTSNVLQAAGCPRCGYVGWAEPKGLSERTRRALRERPLETRRLRLV
jgi:predicted  nucleic acid-binding Zn-ribbon protein